MKTNETRPTVLAVLGCEDFGPGDNGLMTARCPHCGAEGRYVYICLMSDGTHKRMMKGCLGTFQRDACARQCETALEKHAHNRASKWDRRVVSAIAALPASGIQALRDVCYQVAAEKKTWMKQKGYL